MHRIPVVYIAGPYRDSRGPYYILENIRKAEKASLFVWKHGAVALCPHKNSALFDGAEGIPDQVWLDGYLELVKRCDAVYAIEGWEESTGAIEEVALARKMGIEVLLSEQEVLEFLTK